MLFLVNRYTFLAYQVMAIIFSTHTIMTSTSSVSLSFIDRDCVLELVLGLSSCSVVGTLEELLYVLNNVLTSRV